MPSTNWTKQSISPSTSWSEEALSSIGSIWGQVLSTFSKWAAFTMSWEDVEQNWEDL